MLNMRTTDMKWTLIGLFAILASPVFSVNVEVSICSEPKLWCLHSRIAEYCGVTEYCAVKSKEHVSDATLNVTLYMESLCPDCKRFIIHQLYPTFLKLYKTGIFNLRLVPYGNAREFKIHNKWIFNCQHGPHECYGNLIETCAIHYLKDIAIIMPFVYCMEVNGPDKATAEKCAGDQRIDYAPIDECVNSNLGNELEHQMAVETDKLDPPHTYVPWITINGSHTEKMEKAVEKDMAKYLCDIYQGKKPDACANI